MNYLIIVHCYANRNLTVFFDFNHEDIVFSAFTIHIRIQLNELHRTIYRKRKTKSARILRFLNLTYCASELEAPQKIEQQKVAIQPLEELDDGKSHPSS